MVLFLTASTPVGPTRDFSCEFNELELAFDALSLIVARGDTLLTAYILDDDRRTQLPLAAFDGSAFSIPLRALERAWVSQLNGRQTPRCTRPTNQESIRWAQQQIAGYKKQISSLEQLVGCFRELQWQAQDRNSSLKARTHFTRLLTTYEQRLAHITQVHRTALGQLSLLRLRH